MTNISSKIEWTDSTWNVVTGCTKVTPGCDNCYAETLTERADLRIPALMETPAAVRFLSCEPLLGPLDLRQWLTHWPGCQCLGCHNTRNGAVPKPVWWGQARPLSWVIVGGESGHGARLMDLDWVRGLRDQCIEAEVPFFFKQVGGRTPKAGGRELDGRTWDEFPLVEAVVS